jgi:hypothetical protein
MIECHCDIYHPAMDEKPKDICGKCRGYRPFNKNLEAEYWLYQNQAALQSVKQGLKDSAEGKTTKRRGFSRFLRH